MPVPAAISENDPVATSGKRKGSRRAAPAKRRFRPRILLLAVGITLAAVAWGYLVYVAIDFGTAARGGDSRAWGFLGLAAIGAMACLFTGLMLVTRLSRAIGLTSGPPARTVPPPLEPPSPASSSTGAHRHRSL